MQVELVEITDEIAQLSMSRIAARSPRCEQVPIKALPVVPFPPLTEFTAHEEELFARMPPHVTEECTQISKTLPGVARHLGEQGAFAVNNLVVRKWKHKVLVIGIHQRERDIGLLVAAIDRVQFHVCEHIVHPAHVPLKTEAESTYICWARDERPGGRFFRDGERTGLLGIGCLIKLAQEAYSLQVFAATETIGNPFTGLARVVQVEHGGHRIDTQSIDMVLAQPENGAGNQEIAHLAPSIIKDVGAPFLMLALARIGVFVEMGAIEVAQAMQIFRKVARNPVEDDTDAISVEIIDEVLEVLWRTVAAGGCKVACHLIAPGGIIGIFGNRHQFDVGKAQFFDIGS